MAALTLRERVLLLARVALQAGLLLVLVEVVAILAASARWDRPVATAAIVLLAGIGTWFAVVLPLVVHWRRTGDRMRQARLVEAAVPALRGRLVTAAERLDGDAGPQGQESPALLGLVARRAARMTADVRAADIHPAGGVTRLGLATAAVALVGLVVTAVGGPFGAARWWLADGDARAAVEGLRFEAEEERARVGDLVLRYVYPQYTGLEPVEVANSTGDAHGPPGTRVHVTARSANPLEAAALVAYEEPALDADVGADGRTLSGSFTIQVDPGFYHLVTYENGEPRDSRPFTITPEPDLPPDVTVDAESDVLEVALDQPIRIAWRARDDYGVSRVVLHLDGKEQPRQLLAPRERRAEVFGELGTRPVQLGLGPGDRVKLQVAAWDNDTFSGSKVGVSREIELVVLGARGLDLQAEERQEVLRDLMLDVLADHLEEAFPPSHTVGGFASWGEAVSKRYEPLDEAIEEYWDGVSADSLEADVVSRVTRTGRELIRYTQVAFVPGSNERPPPDAVGVTSGLRDKAIVALEDGVLALDRTITMRALRHVAEDAQKLATAAQNLREMMEGEPDVQEMLSRLDRLERQLADMMESAAKLEEGGLKEFVNQRTSEMQSLMDEIREAIAQGRMDEARELMDQLTRQIQQLSEGIEDNLEQMIQEGSDAMQQAEDLQRRLEELEEKQLVLQEEVRQLREQGDARSAEAAEDLWEELVRRTSGAVDKGRAYGKELEEAKRPFNEVEVAQSATEQLEHMAEAAAARDLNGVERALPPAWREWESVERRQEYLERIMGEMPGPGPREIGAIKREIAAIQELLEQLEEVSQQVSPETREQVREQRQRQEQLGEELREAGQQAQQLQREFPVRPEGLQEGLEDAQEQMGQASDDLGRGQPMQAEGAQEMAAQRIRDARESLRRAMEQAQQQQMQLQQRPNQGQEQQSSQQEGKREQQSDPRATVELPSPEEFRTPEEYRRALLEGMQGDVPEEYEALKKRYYEELVHQ